ncbi:COMPASS component SPP1 [Pelomyxa schiedti]|nr:COMPASS component SPP1 [Pelomyxa schiedti]
MIRHEPQLGAGEQLNYGVVVGMGDTSSIVFSMLLREIDEPASVVDVPYVCGEEANVTEIQTVTTSIHGRKKQPHQTRTPFQFYFCPGCNQGINSEVDDTQATNPCTVCSERKRLRSKPTSVKARPPQIPYDTPLVKLDARIIQGWSDVAGRTIYQVHGNPTATSSGSNPTYWVPADSITQTAILKFENRLNLDGSPPCCKNPVCHKPISPTSTSKYCTVECGMQVARARLRARVKEKEKELFNLTQKPNVHKPSVITSNTPMESRAQTNFDKILAENKVKISAVEDMIRRLKAESIELDKLVRESNQFVLSNPPPEEAEVDKQDSQLSLDCPSCGEPTSLAKLGAHLDVCYYKREAHSTVASLSTPTCPPTRSEFCGVFDPQINAYCHRLRVSCPLHNSIAKSTSHATAVCGYPSHTQSGGVQFCRILHSKCTKHVNWKSILRNNMEQQFVRQECLLRELQSEQARIHSWMHPSTTQSTTTQTTLPAQNTHSQS